MANSFGTHGTLTVGKSTFTMHKLGALKSPALERLPFSMKILLENLLRNEDGRTVRRDDVEALLAWNAKQPAEREIAFRPARVLLQDFTGVPCIVALGALRVAVPRLPGAARRTKPRGPVELRIEHPV